jgi:glycosyltransferase involved in cell wall biosynthesis
MACGTPVITSRVASLPEVTGQAALLVDPQNIETLSDGMIQMLQDRSLADRLRTAGLDRAAQFTWPRCARQHADLFRRILEK